MPYYFGTAYDNYFNNTYGANSSGCSYNPNISQIEMFVDDILDWADMKFGEEGDCEDETDPKSNRNTYNTFYPKSSDITKYGIFLRNFMDMRNIGEDLFTNTYNIYNYIFDSPDINLLETLFHSLSIDDQSLFIENIPTIQYDLRRYFNRESRQIDCELNNYESDSSDDEGEEKEEDNNSTSYDDAYNIIRIIGNLKFEEMITLCDDINNETKTVYDLFSFIQREFSAPGQMISMWDDIIICCSSIYYGKLDEGYLGELLEIPEAPECSWDCEEESDSEDEEDDNEENENDELSDTDDLSDYDDMPELENVSSFDDMPELLSPSQIDDNFFEHNNIEPIPIASFDYDEAFAHLESAHITVRRNRHPPRSIRV